MPSRFQRGRVDARCRRASPDIRFVADNDTLSNYKQRFRVGDFEVDPGALSVQTEGVVTRLKPKAMAVLVELAQQPGLTVTRDELLDRVWKSVHVTPGVVGHAITALRRAFGDSLEAPGYIETIPRIGYRLLAPVVTIEADAGTNAEAAHAAPPGAGPAPEPGLEPQPPQPSPVEPAQTAIRDAPPRRRAPWRAIAIMAGLALAFAAGAYWLQRSTAVETRWLEAQQPRRITFATGSETAPRLNAGGDWLVYSRAQDAMRPSDLMLQSAYGTRARVLAGGERAQRPAWSADGRRVAYVRQDDGPCELRIVGIDDAARTPAFRCPGAGQIFFDWNPGDPAKMVYAAITPGQADGSRLALLVDEGGWKTRALDYARERDYLDLDPRYAPDGGRIAFRRGGNPTSDLYVTSARGGAVTRVTEVRARINGFDWLPDGSGLVFSSDHEGRQALYAVDLETRRIVPLGIDNASAPDVSTRSWAMVYQLDGWRSALAEASMSDDAALPRILGASSGRDRAASLSQDDARIAFVSDRDGSQQVWLLERASGATRRLTRHRSVSIEAPSWSADGRRLLYVIRARGRHQLWEAAVDGGANRRLVDSRVSLRNAVYAGDGHSVWYAGWDGKAWRLHRCARGRAAEACRVTAQAPFASRVERGSIGGTPALVLLSPQRSGELHLVREAGLTPLRRLRLPVNDGWSVAGDQVWFFPGSESRGAGALAVHAMSLRDGSVRRLAVLPGLRLLRYSAPQATRDGKRLIAPVVLEDSTDIAFARLVRATPP